MPSVALVPATALLVGIALGGGVGAGAAAPSVMLVAWATALVAFVARRPLVLVVAAWIAAASGGAVLAREGIATSLDAPLTRAVAADLDQPRRDATAVWIRGRLTADASPGALGVSLSIDADTVERDATTLPIEGRLRVSVAGQLAAEASRQWREGRIVRLPVVVRRPLAFRNPGVPDQQVALARRGLALLGSTKSGALVEVLSRGSLVAEAGSAARAWVRQRVSESVGAWDPRSAGIVTAILIGDRAGLSPDVEDRLQRAGTFHVIAISGGNIAVLVAVALLVAHVAGAGPRHAATAAALVLVAYGAVVDGGSSVARAIAMGLGWLAGRALGLRGAAVNLLATAVVVLAIARPLLVFDAGFALSVAATLGIIVGVSRLSWQSTPGAERSRRAAILRAAWGVAAATACAEIAVLPITASAFSQVTVAGVLLNFVAVPAMAVIQLAGMAAVAAGTVATTAGQGCGLVAHLAVLALVESARLVDAWPALARRVPPPSLPVVGAYYAAWLVALAARRPGIAWGSAGAGTLLGALMFAGAATPTAWPWSAPPRDARTLRVAFLDVAQGDAALVRFPSGATMLVDAGGLAGTTFDMGARVVAPALWALGVRRLDRLVLTHGDPDHIGGAPTVLDVFRPRVVWEGIPVMGHVPGQQLRVQAQASGVPWTQAYAGISAREGDVTLRVFHPQPPEWERRRVRNDDSIVIEARHGAVSFVLMGDAGTAIERALDGAIAPAAVRVLKAGHHGSADATSEAWLRQLRPGVVVVSAGRNNVFGHPSRAMLERARTGGAEVLRTDNDGAVQAVSDGRSVAVSTWDGQQWVTRRVLTPRP